MKSIYITLLSITTCFSLAVPAKAYRTPSTPCGLAVDFLTIHATIAQAADKGEEAGDVAVRIRNTSRWRPYKRVEQDWDEIRSNTSATLETLSNLQLAMDASPENSKKDIANDLIYAYQNALLEIADRTRLALYVERTENTVSMNVQGQFLTYSVPHEPARVNARNSSRSSFDAKITEGQDALRSLKLPEHLYGAACRVRFPSFGTR